MQIEWDEHEYHGQKYYAKRGAERFLKRLQEAVK